MIVAGWLWLFPHPEQFVVFNPVNQPTKAQYYRSYNSVDSTGSGCSQLQIAKVLI